MSDLEVKSITAVVKKLDGKPNLKGHIYPKDVMERAVKGFQNIVGSDMAIGYLGQDNASVYPSVTEASHKITDLHIDGDNLVATITPLSTPNGKTAVGLLKSKAFWLGCRGIGTLDKDGKTVVDYELVSVDIIAGPEGAKETQ